MLIVGSNMHDINVLKRKIAKSFVTKDLGVSNQILGMRIKIDRKKSQIDIGSRRGHRKGV